MKTLILTAVVICCASPAFAQQRVIVEKATGNVVDVGDSTLMYDTRFFDHMDLAQSPIPPGQEVRKYRRDAAGAIVLRPKDELLKISQDEWRNDLIARINGTSMSLDLKSILIELVKAMRR
jgi:hypothetical protein